ncbi:MAG: PAS domain S-box-containing protein [Oleispira sp.]|jgi:PAS domain S-box-containing protein|tara:strand:+ start:366 stop:896 length:531 start_codon:yes stop_codon:yes gene_type:complete
MKPPITIKDEEIKLHDGEFIVSKTDTTGRVTYANRVFMEICGYSEEELLGVQHNIIRHPDMPRGVYRFLWSTIETGQEFFGFVKNLCADGRYYWVFANVTPDYDINGEVIGYLSVRRKPSQKAIDTLGPIYKAMIDIESNSASKKTAPDESIAFLVQQLEDMKIDYQSFVLGLFNE